MLRQNNTPGHYHFTLKRITACFSYNNRITDWLRLEGTAGSLWSTYLLLKGGWTRAGCSGHIHSGFSYFQGWRLHKVSGQPVPEFDHHHSKKNFLSISVCAHRLLFCHFFAVMPPCSCTYIGGIFGNLYCCKTTSVTPFQLYKRSLKTSFTVNH